MYDYELSVDDMEARLDRLDLTGCSVDEFYELDLARMMASNWLAVDVHPITNVHLSDVERLRWAAVAVRCIDLSIESMPINDPRFPRVLPRPRDVRRYWTARSLAQRAYVCAAAIHLGGPCTSPGDLRDPEALADWLFDIVDDRTVESVPRFAGRLRRASRKQGNDMVDAGPALAMIERLSHDGTFPLRPPRDEMLRAWMQARSTRE